MFGSPGQVSTSYVATVLNSWLCSGLERMLGGYTATWRGNDTYRFCSQSIGQNESHGPNELQGSQEILVPGWAAPF